MIPNTFQASTPPGEKSLFNKLSKAPGTESWYCLHSLDIADHRSQVMGELDFLIIVPKLGLLFLEVKSHLTVSFSEGEWIFGRGQYETRERRGPFTQASEAMHSLMRSLNAGCPNRPDLGRAPFISAAVFPRVRFSAESPEWHPWQVVDRRDLSSKSVKSIFENILELGREKLARKNPGFHIDVPAPSPEQCEAIKDFFRGDFEAITLPGEIVGEELDRYTQEQFSFLDMVDSNSRILCRGPAGTGKTILALEAARRASAAGRKTLLVCYNKLLGEWLKKQTEDMGPNVETLTIHQHMLRSAGLSVAPEDADDSWWDEILPELAAEKLIESDSCHSFDELIVDEAQDIMKKDWLDFLDWNLKDGLSAGRWRMFGDFEKQSLFRSFQGKPEDIFNSRVGTDGAYAQCELRVNCRNRAEVSFTATVVGGLAPPYSSCLRETDTETHMKLVAYPKKGTQEELLSSALGTAIKQGYKPEEIVVLSMVTASDSIAAKMEGTKWKDQLKPLGKAGAGDIGYESVFKYKGLENLYVILTDIEDARSSRGQDCIYVGATRSTDRVTFLVSGASEQYFRERISEGARGRND